MNEFRGAKIPSILRGKGAMQSVHMASLLFSFREREAKYNRIFKSV